MTIRILRLSAVSLAAASCLAAGTIDFSLFSTDYTQGDPLQNFYGFAVDPTTGTFYAHSGYGARDSTAPVTSYSNLAAFQTNSPSSSVSLSDSSPCDYSSPCQTLQGTYFGANNGTIVGRQTDSTSALAQWSGADGSMTGSASLTAFNGANCSGTFDWCGFSGMDILQDGTGTYLLSVDANTDDWDISTLNGLTITNTIDTGISNGPGSGLGYAFAMDGTIFAGNRYSSPDIQYAIDAVTGQVKSVSDTLSLAGVSDYYISDAFFDPSLDTLFVYNGTSGGLYSADEAAAQFGISSAPEPGTLPVTAALLASAFLILRKRSRTDVGSLKLSGPAARSVPQRCAAAERASQALAGNK